MKAKRRRHKDSGDHRGPMKNKTHLKKPPWPNASCIFSAPFSPTFSSCASLSCTLSNQGVLLPQNNRGISMSVSWKLPSDPTEETSRSTTFNTDGQKYCNSHSQLGAREWGVVPPTGCSAWRTNQITVASASSHVQRGQWGTLSAKATPILSFLSIYALNGI